MSEFKFSCPNCDQHIACDDEWVGAQIRCPTCQAELTVPAPAPPPPAVGVSGPAVAPAARPAWPPSAPVAAPAAKGRTSGLAIASLICSASSLVSCGLGSIPGIICGHLAKARMRRDPSLKGRGLATAGLVLGYGFAGLTLAVAVAVVCFGVSLAQLAKLELRKATESQTPGPAGQAEQAVPPTAAPQRPGAAGPAKNGRQRATTIQPVELTGVSIPDTVASGRIHGAAFTCERAEMRGRTLILRQGRDFFPDLGVEINLGTPGKSPPFARRGGRPQDPWSVTLIWRPAGSTVP